MKITRFEDIETWQEARALVKMVYDVVEMGERFKRDQRLVNQIQSAAVSSMANVAEGFSRKSNREFVQYLFISKSSAAEVQSHLYVALDRNYIPQDAFHRIYDQAEKVSKMASGFIKYLRSQPNGLNERKKPKYPTEPNQPH